MVCLLLLIYFKGNLLKKAHKYSMIVLLSFYNKSVGSRVSWEKSNCAREHMRYLNQAFLSCVSLLTTSGGAVVLTTIGSASHPHDWIICGESDKEGGGRGREREESERERDKEGGGRENELQLGSISSCAQQWSNGVEWSGGSSFKTDLDLISSPPADSFPTSGSITETCSRLP